MDEAAGRPDLILPLAHHVAENFRRQGHPRIQIRARALASLNGRKEPLLIDPAVDLAAEPHTLAPARWILPLTTALESRPAPKSSSTVWLNTF